MALETANKISELVSANPVGADPVGQGNDHIQNLKKAVLFDSVRYSTLAEAQGNLEAKEGGKVFVDERTAGNGGGGVWYYVTGETSNGFDIVDHDSLPLQLKLKRGREPIVDPAQLGVTYGGVGVIETAALQAAVDLAREIANTNPDPDSGFEVLINGHIRIDDTIDARGRCRFRGFSQAASRIIWSGGASPKAMINYGAASWGGFSFCRVQGYDQAAGQDPILDGCAHLLSYTFIDFMHTHNDAHFVGGADDLITLDPGPGENALTNFMLNNVRADIRGNGWFMKLLSGLGGKRPIFFNGCTIDNAGPEGHNPGGVVDCSALTSGILVQMIGGRLEFNNPTDKADFALFHMGGSGTLAAAESNVSLTGVGAFIVGLKAEQAVVRRAFSNCCSYEEVGCNIDIPRMYDAGLGEYITEVVDNAGVTSIGTQEALLTVGKATVLSSNTSDRLRPNATTMTHATTVICDDQVCDYIRLSDADDPGIYGFASTGFTNVGQIESFTAGSFTANIDPASNAGRMLPTTKVRIVGAGTAGGNLDTEIVSVDSSNVVTFADACITTVPGTVSLQRRGGRPWYGFLNHREELPDNPSQDSVGTDVYVASLGATAQWDGFRWMYSSEYAVPSGSRPAYVNSAKNIGRSVFDTTLGKPIWWDGTQWVDATGSAV